MSLTSSRFLELFPEFSLLDIGKIETSLVLTTLETGGYLGLPETIREVVIGLSCAHYLEIDKLLSVTQSNGQKVKKYKSKQDEIEYQTSPSRNPYDYNTTLYGIRLLKLLESIYVNPDC